MRTFSADQRGTWLMRRSPITPVEQEWAQQLVKSVPYSDHSSFSELESFVSQLRPQAILPVVRPPHSQGYCTDPQVQFRHLLSLPDAGRQSWLPDSTRVRAASEGPAPLCWQVMLTEQSMLAAPSGCVSAQCNICEPEAVLQLQFLPILQREMVH